VTNRAPEGASATTEIERGAAICIIQARTGSSRLPGKVLADLGGRPMLRFLLDRLERLDVDEVVVATSTETRDDAVAEIASAAGRPVVRGPEHDVLARFVQALDAFPARDVVRITADCPLTDPELIGLVLDQHRVSGADYTSNTLPRTFPKGLDVEVAKAGVLRVAYAQALTVPEREHVMPYLYRRPERFRLANVRNDTPLGNERWTVDTADDLSRIREICAHMGDRTQFGWREVLDAVGTAAGAPHGAVALRPAYANDVDFVRECRSDDVAVHYSVTGAPIDRADHERWFAQRLVSPGRPMWVGEVDGVPTGTVRLDVHGGVGEVGVAVHPAARGRRLGRGLLVALLDEVRGDQQVVDLSARVHRANEPSLRAFRGTGFVSGDAEGANGEEGDFVTLRRDPRLPMEEV
jgi:spore coat polysaccharide biosynthesis protein SpsF